MIWMCFYHIYKFMDEHAALSGNSIKINVVYKHVANEHI